MRLKMGYNVTQFLSACFIYIFLEVTSLIEDFMESVFENGSVSPQSIQREAQFLGTIGHRNIRDRYTDPHHLRTKGHSGRQARHDVPSTCGAYVPRSMVFHASPCP